MKVALVAPLAIVTLLGRVVFDELSLSVTTAPPLGAGPFKVTVPCDVDPPLTLVGLTVTVLNAGGVNVS